MPIPLAFDSVGNGPAVVLIHGFPLSRRIWQQQLLPLSQGGYRVIAPDLPGFGATPPLSGGASMSAYADAVIALLDALQIEKAVIGGMSMGGYVLFDLVARHPQRLAGALFIVTRAAADDAAAKAKRAELAARSLTEGVDPVAELFSSLVFAPATKQTQPELVAAVRAWMEASDPRGVAAALTAMAERPDRGQADLAAIGLPALAIGAELDQAIAPENARSIADAIPGARFCLIPGTGHLANMEAPEPFNACILDFLRTLPPW